VTGGNGLAVQVGATVIGADPLNRLAFAPVILKNAKQPLASGGSLGKTTKANRLGGDHE
jgi:hypothetical protein